jgi:hypothetical protein
MASSGMNKNPSDTLLTNAEPALRDNAKPLLKTKLETPPVESGLGVVPPADDPADGWYEP